ncbi:MAG: ATP-binding cassette domain-containing protein [Alphaproteobacteria bacterium]|nr:ATP-binding cassette domain-containing protein [Alphaproteobacteria bacterium]
MFGCAGITKSFNGRTLLNDFSFKLEAGEGLGLLGPSGVGKSTLLKILALLEPADSGNIVFNQCHWPARAARPADFPANLMLQHCALWPHLTLEENIMFPFIGHADEAQYRTRALHFAKQLDLENALPRKAILTSGGENQRASLVRLLSADPEVLLLDEPTSHLDEARAAKVLLLLQEQKENGKAIILSTHDRAFSKNLCDNFITLHEEHAPTFIKKA